MSGSAYSPSALVQDPVNKAVEIAEHFKCTMPRYHQKNFTCTFYIDFDWFQAWNSLNYKRFLRFLLSISIFAIFLKKSFPMPSKGLRFEKSLCFDLLRFFGGKFENTYYKGCVINEVIDRICKQRSQKSRRSRVARVQLCQLKSLKF